MKDRIKSWLMQHPKVLSLLFLLTAKGSEYIPDGFSTQSGASSTLGP